MKSKLDTSIAQLVKLKNQIRVQLNQIRHPQAFPLNLTQRVSKKKLFPDQKYTDLQRPQQQSSASKGIERKKLINQTYSHHEQFNRAGEKKHYAKHYSSPLSLGIPNQRRKNNYLNIKTEPDISPKKNNSYGTSLAGIGRNSKDYDNHRPSIKVFPPQFISTIGISIGRKKSVFY